MMKLQKRVRAIVIGGLLWAVLIINAEAKTKVTSQPFGKLPDGTAVEIYILRDGAFVWDNLWFEGVYPLADYSLLYYLPAALVGNLALVPLVEIDQPLDALDLGGEPLAHLVERLVVRAEELDLDRARVAGQVDSSSVHAAS